MRYLNKVLAGPLQDEAGDIEAMGNVRRAILKALEMPLKATGKALDKDRDVSLHLAEIHDDLGDEIKEKAAAWKRSTLRRVK